MQRLVNIKAKVGLRSTIIVQDLDVYYLRGYFTSHNISSKVQTQGFKDSFRLKKSKPKDLKLALSYDNMAELFK